MSDETTSSNQVPIDHPVEEASNEQSRQKDASTDNGASVERSDGARTSTDSKSRNLLGPTMAAASRIKRWSNKGSGRIALLISLFTLGVTGYQTLITQEQADVARRQADLAQAQVAQLNNQFRLSGAFVAARNDVVLDAAPFGVKLSKGDIALNAPGTTIDTERIDHYHVFLRTFVDNTGRQPALIKDYHVEVERDKYAQAVGTPFRSSPMNCARQNARSEDCSKILPLTLNPGQTLTIETYINQWFPNIIDAGIGEDGLKYWLDVMAQTRSLSMV